MLQLLLSPTMPVSTLGIETVALLAVKLIFVIGAILYFLFSVLVIRQIQMMRQTLETSLSGLLLLLGIGHLVLALGVVILFLLVL